MSEPLDLEAALSAVRADAPPDRSRGVIALIEDRCTSCMLCARECPDWCIDIASHPEVEPAAQPGGRPRSRYVLDRFAIDWSLCLWCGICIEVCPFDALAWAPVHELAGSPADALVHEREQLSGWAGAVPPGTLSYGSDDPGPAGASPQR